MYVIITVAKTIVNSGAFSKIDIILTNDSCFLKT